MLRVGVAWYEMSTAWCLRDGHRAETLGWDDGGENHTCSRRVKGLGPDQ